MMMNLISDIRAALADERDTVNKYRDLARRAYENGYEDICSILEDLSNEEKTHVVLLENMLTSMSEGASTDHTHKG